MTTFALLHLYDKVSAAIDNREYTVGIFLDLSKAFDTVIIFCLINLNIMVFLELSYSGSSGSQIVNSLFNSMATIPCSKTLNVVFHKDPFLGPLLNIFIIY